MNDQILQDILRRLQRLDQTTVRYRAGEVTDVGPLDVALGGSDVPYEDVASVAGVQLNIGDQVAALLWGNDMLVLGRMVGSIAVGTDSVTWPGATPSSDATTIAHGLGVVPASIQLTNIATTNTVLQVVGGVTTTTTQFQVSATTRDGTSPPAATTRSFYWQAAA